MHELVANAARHGSLAVAKGELHISWQPDAYGLLLRWIEAGGRTPKPSKAGFGTIMLDAIRKKQLKGHEDRTWAADGVDVAITVPVTL